MLHKKVENDEIFSGTVTYLEGLRKKEKHSDIFNSLHNISEKEQLFEFFLDSISLTIMDEPVILNDRAYDFSTLKKLPIDHDGYRKDPFTRHKFTLQNLGPAYHLVEEFHNLVRRLRESNIKKESNINNDASKEINHLQIKDNELAMKQKTSAEKEKQSLPARETLTQCLQPEIQDSKKAPANSVQNINQSGQSAYHDSSSRLQLTNALRTMLQDTFAVGAAMKLIRLGADPNIKNEHGDSLLHILVRINKNGKHDKTIEELINTFKVDIHAWDRNNYTPLKCLMNSTFNVSAAMKLVRLGASPNSKDKNGDSLLHILVRNNKTGEYDKTIEELIKVFKVDIHAWDKYSNTPLKCLISGAFNVDDAMKLIRLGANANTKDKHGDSLLHILVRNNKNGVYDNTIEELIKVFKVDIHAWDRYNDTPLKCLISGAFNVDDAMKLIRLGANANTKDINGDSLLHILIRNNKNGEYDKTIDELIKTFNADIHAWDKYNNTPLKCLISGAFNVNDAMKLIRLGANPNTKDKNGDSLLHILVRNNTNDVYDKVIEELIKIFKVDIHAWDKDGYTPLKCLMNGKGLFTDIAVMKLIRLGADSNTKDKNGDSLLHILVHNNKNGEYDKTIDELIKKFNADIHAWDKNAYTPLKCLMNNDSFNANAAMKLVRLGANPNTKDKNGDSLLHILIRNNKNGEYDKHIDELMGYNNDTTYVTVNCQAITPPQYLIKDETVQDVKPPVSVTANSMFALNPAKHEVDKLQQPVAAKAVCHIL